MPFSVRMRTGALSNGGLWLLLSELLTDELVVQFAHLNAYELDPLMDARTVGVEKIERRCS